VFPPRPGRWLLGGLFLTVLGLTVIRSDLVLDPAFTRVDLYHCIQLGGLYCFSRGAKGVRSVGARYRLRQVAAWLGRFQLTDRRNSAPIGEDHE